MITNIVVDYIATKFPLLIKKTNLFAESAPVSKCVYAKLTTTTKSQQIDSHFRKSYIRINVKGYNVNEGNVLCNNILTELENMKGDFEYGEYEKYLVLDSNIQDFSYPSNIDGANVSVGTISINYYFY